MKYPIHIVASLLIAAPIFSQTATDGRDVDRDALRALARKYEDAINSGNLKTLADSVDPTASAVFVTGDELAGIPAIQQYFEGMMKFLGPGSSYKVKLDADATQFLGDVALAKGTSNETAVLGTGQTYQYTGRWTAVLRKTDGQWKALRLHASLNPFENPIIAAKLNIRTWTTAGIAAAGGFILAWLVVRRRRQNVTAG